MLIYNNKQGCFILMYWIFYYICASGLILISWERIFLRRSFAVPSVANTANNVIVESPLTEMNMQAPENDIPDFKTEVTYSRNPDGSYVAIVTTVVTLNGKVIAQYMKFVVSVPRPKSNS